MTTSFQHKLGEREIKLQQRDHRITSPAGSLEASIPCRSLEIHCIDATRHPKAFADVIPCWQANATEVAPVSPMAQQDVDSKNKYIFLFDSFSK
jgi:hypothetical protein